MYKPFNVQFEKFTTMKKINRTMNTLNKNNMSSLFLRKFAKGILLFGLFVSIHSSVFAQEPVASPLLDNPSAAEGPKWNRFSLGMKASHLYDLRYTSYDLLSTGVSASDPYGLHGAKTKFDLAVGLDVNYYFSPLFSMDLGYEKGKMTGANKTEYYTSNVSFLTLGANIDLKRSLRTNEYRLVPYARASISRGTFDAERKFIADDVTFSNINGTAILLGVGLGFRYHINNNWCVNVMSEFVSINTDAWDGYDYGTGKDQMIKSSVGLKYSFGRGKHIDRAVAWQDNRVDRMQARIDDQVNSAIKSISDSVDTKFKKMMNIPGTKDSDDDGIVDKFDKCPDVAGLFSNNGCPPVEEVAKEKEQVAAVEKTIEQMNNSATAPNAATGEKIAIIAPAANNSNRGLSNEEKYRLKNEILVEMNPIRFSINSYQLNAKAYEYLNTIAVIMRNNPSYTLSLKGYTDDNGSAAYNKKLAQNRATAVSEYLQSRGIDAQRISILAVGKESPLDDNRSEIGKSNNRRVECKLD